MGIPKLGFLKELRGRSDSDLVKFDPLETTIKVASKHYKCLNTPVSLSCYLLLKYGEYDQLVMKSVLPSEYNCGSTFRKDYAAVKFLAKCAGLPTTFDLTTNALRNEADGEVQCKQTNLRWQKCCPEFHVSRMLNIAKDLITEILGAPPTFEEIVDGMKFGPGASTATTGFDTTIVAKISSSLHSTDKARLDLAYAVQQLPMLDPRFQDVLDLVGPLCGPCDDDILNYSSWCTAPKNAKTHRGIATQIHGLMLGQKSLGSTIRKRLVKSRFKLDLDYLWRSNQFFARVGSRGSELNPYVTFDITNASSTIAYETVYNLFPRSWALLLDRWREPSTDYLGTKHDNFKFSAMGNGYTFEMESVLFFALAKAAQIYSGDGAFFCSSFGDDIIVTQSSSENLIDLFNWCGLRVNKTKSFTDGYFRESCGGDYWDGNDVTPVYLKELLHDEISLVKLANRIRHYSTRYVFGIYSDISAFPVWASITDLLRKGRSNVGIGSKELGDTVLWTGRNDKLPTFVKPVYFAGLWYFRVISKENHKRRQARNAAELHSWYYAKQSNGLGDEISLDLKDRLRGYYGCGQRTYLKALHGITLDCVSNPTMCRGTKDVKKTRLTASSEMMWAPDWR
nr:MAG: RNA-dependent RNA polymerase [Riboviria sp.]